MVRKCTAHKTSGEPCNGNARDGSAFCWSHDPELAERRAEGRRRGGEERSNARRAARQWAAVGEVIAPSDLPAMLRGAFVEVWQGNLEPSQAQALVSIAKASVSLSHDLELEQRIARLEEAAGIDTLPSNVRRIS